MVLDMIHLSTFFKLINFNTRKKKFLALLDFKLLVTLTLQANYGMGGQYGAHYDPHNYYEDKRDSPVYLDMGDRFATFMVRNIHIGSFSRYEKKPITEYKLSGIS